MARPEAPLTGVDTESTVPTGALSLVGLDDLLGFHLKRAQATFHRDFLLTLKGLELSQKQFAVLSLLSANPGASQINLANTLGTDRATMMAIVDRLQGRGLLLRSPSRTDRRRQDLYLTKEAMALLARGRTLVEAHEKRFKSAFSPGELEQLIELLRRIPRVTSD